ncbi:MAG: GGDEF domain-containing protein [Methylococcales bacterium]|nr:GGDEF domain-containing protein [Methylococcales bacterium]
MKEEISVYRQILNDINRPENEDTIVLIGQLIAPHSNNIAKHFYRTLLGNNHASSFLNHDAVKYRLTGSMTRWVDGLFSYRPMESDIDDYINDQLKVGHIHARIELPVCLVNYGMILIKNKLMSHLIDSPLDRKQLANVMVIVNNLVDCSLAIINESYKDDLVDNENQNQAFRLHASAHNLAFECERLRTSLSEWMREIMILVQDQGANITNVPTIRHSSFGLWIVHKANLYLHGRSELGILNQLLDDIDEALQELEGEENEAVVESIVKSLNNLITNTVWLLGNLAKEMIEEDSGKDTLTHLLNRHYLDTVLRQETDFSLHKGMVYGLIYVDIDHFKQINDDYGHDNGDRILVQIAEILTNNIRTGDFVFRLGGEEFLVVLGDIDEVIIGRVAEKIRASVAGFAFKIDKNRKLNVTISLGTAFHDGHPDYTRTMKQADDALYKAKANGRNQVVNADQPIETYRGIKEKMK